MQGLWRVPKFDSHLRSWMDFNKLQRGFIVCTANHGHQQLFFVNRSHLSSLLMLVWLVWPISIDCQTGRVESRRSHLFNRQWLKDARWSWRSTMQKWDWRRQLHKSSALLRWIFSPCWAHYPHRHVPFLWSKAYWRPLCKICNFANF